MSFMSDSEEDYGDEQLTSGDDDNYAFASHEESTTRQARYIVYNDSELRDRQRRSLDQVTSVLSVSDGDAVRLLCEYKWDVNRVNEEWFADTDAVRDKVGLQDEFGAPPHTAARQVKCGICFDTFDSGSTATCGGACHHHFCKDCWRQYVHTSINGGAAALSLRCPVHGCTAAVPHQVVREVASAQQLARLQNYALRSFVEDSRTLTWCPAPGCENAVESSADLGAAPLDVACKCGGTFCFQCKEEAHRPVMCSVVRKWLVKNSAESENLNWIMAHTKQCPKCKRPIEKNQGCMHMTCSQCRFEFCWLCLGSWVEHGERTGGFYACNRFESAEKAGEYDEEARRREQAKNALERYMHYYQRWAENDKAKAQARRLAQHAAEGQLHRLSELTATPTSQLKFISDAWDQVVECRRILKWTYTYGYYTFGEQADQPGSTTRIPAARLKQYLDFFEYNQGQAEAYLEKLHDMAENKLKYMQDSMEPGASDAGTASLAAFVAAPEWPFFRQTLIGLTDVTRSHFSKLVEELEKGMQEMMASYSVREEEAAEAALPEPAKQASKKAAGGSKRARTQPKDARTRAQKADASQGDSDLEAEAGHWQCRQCTFANTDLNLQECSICGQPRAAR